MSNAKGPEGLRDSVFKAIISDRISMSTPEPKPSSQPRCFPKTGTSISFRETPEDSHRFMARSVVLTAKSASLESVRVLPGVSLESLPGEPKMRKAPSTRSIVEVDKKTVVEWLRSCRKGDVARCEGKDIQCFIYYFERPFLVNYVPPYFLNHAAIHVASLGHHFDLIHLLSSYGADLNAQTLTGYTALHLAAQKEDKETVKLLVAMGADECVRDVLGYTYRHYAPWLEELDYDICLRDNSSRQTRSRPLSQASMDSSFSADSGPLPRQGSFRSALRKLVVVPSFSRRRSASPN